ncbi:MAG: protein kinase family protein [Alphaproteobacteria bacterium]|nr:protein kinase family protein [Alphaproteobacteria bacterium]
MAFPIINDYKAAFRNPSSRFATLRLTPMLDAKGSPAFMAGNFAAVFKAVLDGREAGEEETGGEEAVREVAVKCFIRDLPDLEKRHQAIEDVIGRSRSPYFIDLRFLPGELFVKSTIAGNGAYPVVLMPWIEGRTMDKVLGLLCEKKHKKGLAALTRSFAKMCLGLLSMGVAHGDLKHDNVIVTPGGQLKLIDCEAMYVPALKGLPSILLGGVNYQHPGRDERQFGPALDHFSMLVMVLSLRALTLEPELYGRYNTGENIILTRQDLVFPRRSQLLSFLSENEDALIRDWTKRLTAALASDSVAVSGLERLLRQARDATADPVQGNIGGLLSLFRFGGG